MELTPSRWARSSGSARSQVRHRTEVVAICGGQNSTAPFGTGAVGCTAVERGAEPTSHRSRSWEMSVKQEGSQALLVGWIMSLWRNLNWGASRGPADGEAP